MTKRECVLSALAHKKTYPVPWQLDMGDEIAARLGRDLGAGFDAGSHLSQERNETFTALCGDSFEDMFGVVWNKEQEGDFGIVVDYILQEPEFGDYKFPVPDEALIREKCARLETHKDTFRMYIIGFSLFERAWTLRSMEELLVDFLVNQEFVHELLERITLYNLAVVDIAAQYDIDCIFFGDDWGQQKGLIMGPDLWREFIKPYLRRMYARVKSHGMYVAQHSCGDVSDIFPDLVELGMDIYNTFQPEVYDVEQMKALYGDKVTFYGGVSTQRLLPEGTPEEVEEETRRMLRLMGNGGGYICAPTHAMPNDIPTENVLAFLRAVQNQSEAH